MIDRDSVIGIAVVCALALCAFEASSASAFQRAYTCTGSATTKEFPDGHCRPELKLTGTKYGHTLIAGENTRAIEGTNTATAANVCGKGTKAAAPSILRGSIAGVETAINCTTLGGMGHLTNTVTTVTGLGEHRIQRAAA